MIEEEERQPQHQEHPHFTYEYPTLNQQNPQQTVSHSVNSGGYDFEV